MTLLISALLMMVAAPLVVSASDTLPKGAVVIDDDLVMYSHPRPVLSPDRHWIAYESKGFLFVSQIATPHPRRINEVKDTWSHVLARPEEARARAALIDSGPRLGSDEFKAVRDKATHRVIALQWTHDSEGIVWGFKTYDSRQEKSLLNFWFAPREGEARQLISIEYGSFERGIGEHCNITHDRRYFVQQGHKRPLIWDIAANKPCATCFYHLTQSSTSGRWIGIEKDTRQLVITDADFQIVERFDEYLPNTSHGFDLEWSPDERFILWRNKIGFDHYSNWTGFRLNLNTGERRNLTGLFFRQNIQFTGSGGEIVRCELTGRRSPHYSGDIILGARLTLVPKGDAPEKNLWHVEADDPKDLPVSLGGMKYMPPFIASSSGQSFAIGLPRQKTERHGWVWHLIDRRGKTWRFPGADNDQYYAPFQVVGFADDDSKLVCHDETRLFTIPVSTIQHPTRSAERKIGDNTPND